MGPAGRTFKLSLSFIRYFFTQNIRDRGMQPTEAAKRWNESGLSRVSARSTPQPWQSGLASHARAPRRRVSPSSPAGPRGAPPSRPYPSCCARRRSAAGTSGGPTAPTRTFCPQPDQAEVLRAVRKHLTPLAVVAAVAKEEGVGHVIVTKAKEVVEARSATMA